MGTMGMKGTSTEGAAHKGAVRRRQLRPAHSVWEVGQGCAAMRSFVKSSPQSFRIAMPNFFMPQVKLGTVVPASLGVLRRTERLSVMSLTSSG